MPFLPGLAVVFVGIVGPGHDAVDRQVRSLLPDLHLEAKALPAKQVHVLATHGAAAKQIVQRLHVDGVVGGELAATGDGMTLKLVIYDGDGRLKSFSELALDGKMLGADELGVLRANLEPAEDEAASSSPTPALAEPDPSPPPPAHAPKAAAAHNRATRVAKNPPAPAPARITPAVVTSPAAPPPAPAPEPAAPTGPPRAPAADHPTAQATAVPAMTASSNAPAADDTAPGVTPEEMLAAASASEPAGAAPERDLHLGASIGLAVTGRNFSPGPSTLRGYSSTPVGAVHLDGEVQPTPRTSLGIAFERTLQMTSPMTTGTASTTMSRWELAGGYTIVRGRVNVAPQLGIGRRSFTIDSTDPSRSPDDEYDYLVLGATAWTQLGRKISLHASAAFEPVVSGSEATEMAFGEATRWGFDVGAGIDLRPLPHLLVRLAADYQQFAWSWSQAGARAAGGATDAYPSGTLTIGAEL